MPTIEPTKKPKRTLLQRIDATRQEFKDKHANLAVEEAIAVGKLKLNAKGEEIAAAGIDVSKDTDVAAYFVSKAAPSNGAPTAAAGEGGKRKTD